MPPQKFLTGGVCCLHVVEKYKYDIIKLKTGFNEHFKHNRFFGFSKKVNRNPAYNEENRKPSSVINNQSVHRNWSTDN